MGATFVSAEKIITGSQDRTVKVPPAHAHMQSVDGSVPHTHNVVGGGDQVWDLGKGYCVRTVFCYSPCNAVAVVGESTRMLCSAHADRRVRLWDLKTADPVAEIQDVQSKQVRAHHLQPPQVAHTHTHTHNTHTHTMCSADMGDERRPPAYRGALRGSTWC
jgi:autophagy-related protein 16